MPAIAEFLAAAARAARLGRPDRIGRGQAFFARLGLHQFTALYLASLPSAYAAAKGVHVLWLTARLQDDPERRLNETAQFLMDVTAPSRFEPGGAAVEPGAPRSADARRRALADRPRSPRRLGRPTPIPGRPAPHRRGRRRGAGR